MKTQRLYPTAHDDAHELGLIRKRKQELWNAFGPSAVERSDYAKLQQREAELTD